MWRINRFVDGNGLDQESVRQSYEMAKSFRAEVIDVATLVELELDDVLCDFFVGSEFGFRERFKSHILSTEVCGLFQKWKILRSAVNTKSEWSTLAKAQKDTALIKELKSLISFRNSFAHDELVVDAKSAVCTLSYFEGERKTIKITKKIALSIIDEAKLVFQWVAGLHYAFEGEMEQRN